MRTIFVQLVAALFFSVYTYGPAVAEWPNGPIEMVMPTGPGSGAADEGRLWAEELAKPENLGVPVKVVFKPGGGGNNAAIYVGQKPADGNQIMFVGGSHAGLFNMPHFKYKFDHFQLIVHVVENVYAIGVPANSPFKTFKDLIAYAKANPGKLSMGSNKVGSLHHRSQTALFAKAGVNVNFIPYKGTGAVVKDVVGGHLPIGMSQPGKWVSHIKSGKARVLLLLDKRRLKHPLFADVPTPEEAGFGYDIPVQFHGFIVRKGTPMDIIKKYQKSFKNLLGSDAMKAFFARHPEVTPAFRDDIDGMNADFKSAMKDARAFMVEHKILKN